MEALEAIMTRRSVRDYTAEPISDDIIEKLLRAGMSAPSAGNQQPWHFVVIRDRTTLDTMPKIHPYAAMTPKVQVGILVCGETSREKHKGFWVQDCSAAAQNILLAARALNLGAVWVGIYPREERVEKFRELVNLPPTIMPLALIPVGYTMIEQKAVDRFKPERIHFEKW